MSLLCYCKGICPDDSGTCVLKPGAQCFSSIEERWNVDNKTMEFYRTFGCLPPEEQSIMQCKGDIVNHHFRKSIKCCNFTDFCNENLLPELKTKTMAVPSFSFESNITLVVSLGAFLISAIIVSTCYLIYRKKGLVVCLSSDDPSSAKAMKLKKQYMQHDYQGLTTGTGAGAPKLMQRTIAHELDVIRQLARGKFGAVVLADYKGEKVVAKYFSTEGEDVFKQETMIYRNVNLCHENVLRYIASDKHSSRLYGVRRVIIVDYHKNGSLRDYLQNVDVLVPYDALKLAATAANGTHYLHNEISGYKQGIAHRDINSKNILVSGNGECVLHNFSSAVVCEKDEGVDVGGDLHCGNVRYMAPELLNETMDTRSFEALKMADVYSLGLVYWEICWRCEHPAVDEDSKPKGGIHRLPYDGLVPDEPKLDDMLDVVVMKNLRPDLPDWWKDDKILRTLLDTIKEAWHADPHSRPNALRMEKRLKILRSY